MIKRFFFFISALVFLCGSTSSGMTSDSFTTHTQHTPIELKPAFLDSDNSFQTAAVCFLGSGVGCGGGDFGKGDEPFEIDTAQQCKNEGYVKLNCNAAQKIDNICPYNQEYGTACVCKPNLIACPSPQTGVEPSCGGKYLSCNCPTGVSVGTYGCREYYASPCHNVCKIAYSDNCHKRTSVSTPYGCMNNFSDCSSKCERAYPDNCRNRMDVAAPNGCKQYWADCKTKCQIALIKPNIGDILYSDGTFSSNVISGKTPIGVIFDAESGLATALDDAPNYYIFGGYATDIPDIENCNKASLPSCGFNGLNNTLVIKKFAENINRTYPAAQYCYTYAPTNCSGWCGIGKWFLPGAAEWQSIYLNKDIINQTLGKLGKNPLTEKNPLFNVVGYWTSNETDRGEYSQWVYVVKNGSYQEIKKYSPVGDPDNGSKQPISADPGYGYHIVRPAIQIEGFEYQELNYDCLVTSQTCSNGCASYNSCNKCLSCYSAQKCYIYPPAYVRTTSCSCTYDGSVWYMIRIVDRECRDASTGSVLSSGSTTETYGGVFNTESECYQEKCAPFIGENWRSSGTCSIETSC